MGVGKNIKALREKFDLTQDQLADSLGVTRESIVRWEADKMAVRDRHIAKMVELYGLDPDDIRSESSGIYAQLRGAFYRSSLPRSARTAVGMQMGMAPRLGKVHAGVLQEPETFDDNWMVAIPQFLLDEDPGCFVVSSEGDCMDRVFTPGSDLVVSRRKQPQDKSIVLASIDGCDAIVRRLRLTASTLLLSPESHNPEHHDIIVTRDSGQTVEVLGVVVWYQAPKELE